MTVTISTIADKKEERLILYYAAEAAILSGSQSYSLGNRSLTRAQLEEIRKVIAGLEGDLMRLGRGNRITAHRVVPRDTV